MSEEPAEAGDEDVRRVELRALLDEVRAATGAEARAYAEAAKAPKRWVCNEATADWLAIKLQMARGCRLCDVARQFKVTTNTIRNRSQKDAWEPLTERDRKVMAKKVLGAGLARARWLGLEPDIDALLAAAEWWPPDRDQPLFTPLDPSPKALPHHEDHNDIRNDPANPDRTHRDRAERDLARLVERLERELREEEADEEDEFGEEDEEQEESRRAGERVAEERKVAGGDGADS